MVQHQDISLHGPRILLVVDETSFGGLISAFLAVMGCTSTVVTNSEDLDATDQETFDAFVIDWTASGLQAEKAIMKLCPTHAEKILLVSAHVPAPRMVQLVHRYDLRQTTGELWPQRLWPTLQEILDDTKSVKDLLPDLQPAELVFDSFRSPAPAGIRGSHRPARQLAYRHQNTTIDVFIEPREESGRVWLAGQVLDHSMKRGENRGLTVLLVDRVSTLARTTTNQHGEFNLDFECLEVVGLQIRLGEGLWASIPLGSMEWIKRRFSGSASGNDLEVESGTPRRLEAKKRGNAR
jgi:CheY-like chemotaxis protein